MSDTLTVSNINYRTISGSTITASTITGSVLNISTLSFQSTVISLGQSTNQRYTNFTNGSFASSLMTSTLTSYNSLSTVTKVSMSQDGRLQYALQSVPSTLSYYQLARSADTGVTWNTLNTSTMGLPQGSLAYQSTVSGYPTYSNISQSATGQYALAATSGGQLYVSNNASSATPVYTPANVGGAPYAYLPFDALPITDMMGNTTITVTGSAPLVAGKVGTSAINLANTAGGTATNYVRGTWTGSSNFTVSFWFNTQTAGAAQVLVGAYNIWFNVTIDSGNVLRLYIPTGINTNTLAATGPTISRFTWYNVVAIFQTGGACSLYVNGTFYGSATNSGALPPCTEFCLGTFGNGTLTAAFNGYIDDFRLFNFAEPNVVPPYIYLPLDGNTTDAMGNVSVANTSVIGNPGYVFGAPVGSRTLRLVNPTTGSASQYVRGTWTIPSTFSVSGWFNIQGHTGGNQFIFSTGGTGANGVVLFVTTGYTLSLQTPGSTYIGINLTTPTILLNQWYYFSFTIIANGTCSLYFNNSITTGTSTASINASGNFGLGTYDSGSTAGAFNGCFDDIKIYNYAVTPSVIVPMNWSHTAVSGTGQYMMAAAANGGVFYSSTYGQSWSQLTTAQILSLVPTGGSAKTLMGPLIQPNNTAATSATWSANGVTWTASASSYLPGSPAYLPYWAFDNTTGSHTAAPFSRWVTSSNGYSTSGNSSGVTMTIQGIGSVTGDWLQLQSSVPLVMYSYTFWVGYATTRLPKTYYIVGSNDGTTWYPVQYASSSTTPSTGQYGKIPATLIVNWSGGQTFDGSTVTTTVYSTTPNAYTYFRLVVLTTYYSSGTDFMEFGEWYINFATPMPLLTAQATAPSTATSAVTVSPQMTNLIGDTTTATPVTTNWSTPNGVTWTSFSRSVNNASFQSWIAFNNTAPTSSTGNYSWACAPSRYNVSGGYIGGISTSVAAPLNTNISGEWLQIQSSTPIVLSTYSFAINSTGNFPRTYYIVGSTDGTTWYPIHFCSALSGSPFGTTPLIPLLSYITVTSGTQTLTSSGGSATGTFSTYTTSSNAYTYFRLIGTSTANNYFELTEWYINFTAYTPNPVNALAISNGGQNMLVAATGTTMPNLLGLSGTSIVSWTANGVNWTVSGSPNLSVYYPYKLFNYTTTDSWAPQSPTYTTAGNSSGVNTTIQGIGSVQGDYAQLQSSVPLVIYSYHFATGGAAQQFPNTFYIIGSNDGTTWYPIQRCIGVAQPSSVSNTLISGTITVATSGSQTFGSSTLTTTTYSTTTNAYIYFRILGTNNYSGSNAYLEIGEWYINFQAGATYLSTNYGSTWSTAVTAPTNAPFLATSGNGQYTITGSGQLVTVYSNAALTTYTTPTLTGINANINCASISSSGQNMIILTQGTTNNVFYSTNFGVTFTGMTVGTLPMTSCAMSADGNEIMVSNAANVWVLNRNTQGFSITMGNQSGLINQGQNSIAIGNLAGVTNQSANSIILNASGSIQDAYNPGFFVSPILPQATSTQTSVNLLGYGADGQVVQSGLTVLSNGYTGIGTVAFGAYLQVYNSNAAFTSGPTVHIGDGQTDMGNYGMLQLVRANNGADNKAYLAFIKNGLTVFGMGYYPGTSQPTFGLVPSFGTMATNNGLWMTSVGQVGIGTTAPGSLLHIIDSATAAYSYPLIMMAPNLTVGGDQYILFGKSGSSANQVQLGFHYVGIGSTANYAFIQNYGIANCMCWTAGGNVGIGITNPSYPLHVSGSATQYVTGGFYFSSATGTVTWTTSNQAVGIYATSSILTLAAFLASSDIRIKKNIQPVTDSLSKINALEYVQYDKIDYKEQGCDIGIVAHNVQTVLPRAVSKMTKIIPNIYGRATHVLESEYVLIIVPCSSSDIKENGKVRLIIVKTGQDKETEYDTTIYNLTSDSFDVAPWDNYSPDDKVFVYGTEVDDFLSVDKDQIGMLAAAGVKELHPLVIQQAEKILSLEVQLSAQTSVITSLEARLAALEAK